MVRGTTKRRARTAHLHWLKALGVIVLVGAIGFSLYSIRVYRQAKPEAGLTFCSDKDQVARNLADQKLKAALDRSDLTSNCFWVAHIHADFKVSRCGAQVELNKEFGDLYASHTHKEPDRLHWHSVLPADEATRKPSNTSSLTVGAALQVLDIETETPCRPDQSAPRVTVRVNSKSSDLDYVWQDGDEIAVIIE